MTLFEAQPYDYSRARKKRNLILGIIAAILVLAALYWHFRFWPEEHLVAQFFQALQEQKYEHAYGVWMHDPDWQQHKEKYARYPYNDFIKDWGPGGEWGIIKSYHVEGAAVPHGYGGVPWATASGVVVVISVNERVADKAHIWVQKNDKTLGFSPY